MNINRPEFGQFDYTRSANVGRGDSVPSNSSDSEGPSAARVMPGDLRVLADHWDATDALVPLGLAPEPPLRCAVPLSLRDEVHGIISALNNEPESFKRMQSLRRLMKLGVISRPQYTANLGQAASTTSMSSDRPLLAGRGSFQALHLDATGGSSRPNTPAQDRPVSPALSQTSDGRQTAPIEQVARRGAAPLPASRSLRSVAESEQPVPGVEQHARVGRGDGSVKCGARVTKSIWWPQTRSAWLGAMASALSVVVAASVAIRGSKSLQNPEADRFYALTNMLFFMMIAPWLVIKTYLRDNTEALRSAQSAHPRSPEENA